MDELIHLIYASAAQREFSDSEIADLLQTARDNNERLGLTGMLLLVDGSFFQVLEGPPEVVDALEARIERDPRHVQMVRIIREAIPRRFFEDWTMGFSRFTREELAATVGANDFFGAGRCFAGLDHGRARKLLAAFREGRWRARLSGHAIRARV